MVWQHQSMVLAAVAVLMGATGVALILWWVADHRARLAASPSDRVELVPGGPGLPPQTMTDYPPPDDQNGPLGDTAHRRR